ncbi:hypothetical protein M231_02507 [Tremella mesenterica]|uniref:J domain-containing protein n=1 Tax=Tremella mesenterica TaxID=5217 RepID=A0A4Q1BQM9_TREME|nr:uncharacterized protein TREMEDRAFT_69805 [Tremella mesenterica DSM 1558]EIW67351.1 hypothetical protein TREMEDRAFT_69805 [Tremella mesenterica DSM 1558]RXK40233.1 hypothetical protein M231_02507 [Tremella mesenterica]
MDDPGPSAAYLRSFPSTSDGPILPPSPPHSPLLSPTQTSAQFLDTLAQDSLYAILNIPREASDSEIRDAYRSIATTYHPDRQRDTATRLAAHNRFTQIQRAYEVLSDPARRTIYDLFGEEGLRTSWEVGPRNQTPKEMRANYQRQAEDKKRLEAEGLVKPKGTMSVVIDSRAVFLPKSYFSQPEKIDHSLLARIKRIRVGQIMMKHSFETPLNEKTQVVWQGQMLSRRGAGGGNVVGTLRHQFSPRLWGEVGMTMLDPRMVTSKATFTYDENTFVTLNTIQQTYKAPPSFGVVFGRRLYAQTTGLITFRSGFWTLGPWGTNLPAQLIRSDRSSLSVALTTSHRDGTGWTVESQAGLVDSHLSADWSTRVMGGLKLKIGAMLGTTGISGFVDGEGRVTETTKFGVLLQAELGGGVTMSLKFNRLGQKITIPILLSQNLNPYIVFGSTVIPTVSYVALYRLYLLPRKRRRTANRIKQLREENAEYIEQKRIEALEALTLMERPTSLKVIAEREKHGLIILSAQYGPTYAFTDKGIREESLSQGLIIDVTIPIQALVNDSKLFIPGGRAKYNILGFYDPCIGENKKLRIRYSFRDTLHEVTVDDLQPLRAPIRAHVIS